MATLTAYPTNTIPKASDLLLGTKIPTPGTTEEPITNNVSISSLASLVNTGFAGGYNVYTALLTQAGNTATDVPVATIMQNTLGGTIVWTRTGAGAYTATIEGSLFTLNKTMVFINGGSATATANIEWASPTTATMTIDTTADSVLTGGSLEIRVYT
tara:strand:- start:131 stop:601 length:471 start_codon:yes stop_codon:yes gene_type:complete